MIFEKKLIGLFVLLLCAAVLLGCTSKPTEIKNTTKNDSVDVSGDKKTGYDKVNETVSVAVADGNYLKNITYPYHSGQEKVEIGISVKDNLVTSAYVRAVDTPNPVSAKFITALNNSLPELVVGKKITELNIPKQVSGGSLTVTAFKSYIDELTKVN